MFFVHASLQLTKSNTPPQVFLRFIMKLVVLNCGAHHILLIMVMYMEYIVQVDKVSTLPYVELLSFSLFLPYIYIVLSGMSDVGELNRKDFF